MAPRLSPAILKSQREGKENRAKFLRNIASSQSIADACLAAGWKSLGAYHKNRSRWPDWAQEVDITLGRIARPVNLDPHDLHRGLSPHFALDQVLDGSFSKFRHHILGRESPWFHVEAADMIEKQIRTAYRKAGLDFGAQIKGGMELDFGGQIMMLLWPPEHGKTAFWEDFDTYALAYWPWFRIVVGSERSQHSQKVVDFVRSRLEPDAPGFELLRRKFGPFAPPKGRESKAISQPWNRSFFNVAKKPAASQRDFSMAAVGMTGSIIGTRTDLLQVDDPQSRKSLNQTEDLVEIFRQDWLSRPGPLGMTVILMNRVGEGDFPQALLDEGMVDHLIKVPVWTEERGWAWPERYSNAHYQKMRRNVGEDAWERNYMQKGLASRLQAFNQAIVEPCQNSLRSITHRPPMRTDGGSAVCGIGIDPGYGIHAQVVSAHEPTKYRLLQATARPTQRPEQQYAILEDALHTYCVDGISWVQYVTVETKAFQRGWITDDRFLELQQRFGFEVIPHMTGSEKNDEDIGVPQMAMSMRRREFDIPAMDEVSRQMFDLWARDFYRWRPHVPGNKLRQDYVMATWFDWMTWRRHRRTATIDASSFNFAAMG